MWNLQTERKSQFHNYFGSYLTEFNNKVPWIIWRVLFLTIINYYLTVRAISRILGCLTALRGNIDAAHTTPGPRSLRLSKEKAVSLFTLAGARGGGGHGQPVQLPHCSWVSAGHEGSVSLQRGSSLNFSHSNGRQIIRQGWKVKGSVVYS